MSLKSICNGLSFRHPCFSVVYNGEELTKKITTEIENSDNKTYLSIASLWEIAIKLSKGKLALQTNFDDIKGLLINNNIELLPISFPNLQELIKLPFIHNDPFDRIILAQSINEKLTVITRDNQFRSYPINMLEA